MASHSEIDREQLKKILLVALSSPEAGEIVAAVRALKNRLKKGGKDIHWFVDQIDVNLVPPLPDVAVVDWDQQLHFCAQWVIKLSYREQEFITSLWGQKANHGIYWQPSYKQKHWLGSIYRRTRIIVDVGL